jgi:hypothetical protein
MGWAGALRSVGLVAALLATSSIVACGGGTSPPPDRGELVRMLVSADDLAGDWALDIGTKNGHVPDLEGWGPQPILCEAAGDAPAAPAVVAWEATRALEHAGRERWAYEIRVQEYLLASSASSARKTYDAFASSMRACAPRLPASSYSGRTTAIELPAVGDARAGIETSYLEKGAARPLAGDMRTVLVLDGTVLMAITLNETDYPEGRPWQPEPQIDDTELGAIVKTMVDKLH